MYISPPLSLYVGKALNKLLTYFCYNYCEYFCPFIYQKKCKFQSADIKRRPSLFLTFEPIFQGHAGWEGNGNSLQFNLISADRLLTIRLASISSFCPAQKRLFPSSVYYAIPVSGLYIDPIFTNRLRGAARARACSPDKRVFFIIFILFFSSLTDWSLNRQSGWRTGTRQDSLELLWSAV